MRKAKDGGDLVWMYYVRHHDETGKLLMITAAKDEAEIARWWGGGYYDEYPLEEVYFDRMGLRRFSRKVASKRIEQTLKEWFDDCGIARPIYNKK